ncbi:OmpA family protein [Mucilaginibacter sp.]
MKKIYLLAVLLLAVSLTICKAGGYQQGFVILKNGNRVGGQIKLYKNAPWKNQRYIWFKDSAAVAANPNAKPKKLYAADMKFYQAGSRQFVKVTYVDQANIKLRNLLTNSWMLERVSNGRFVAYMYYSSPPEFFDYFFADPKGDQTEPAGNDNAMIKYRIIFKKDTAKHFVNAYSYGLASYFKDTPQILQKYSTGAYGNQPDVDGSIFTRLSEICNRTIFTSQAETNGIIAAFNDYNQIYAPKVEVPKPTPAQSTADLFKPYLFKGTIIDNDTHKVIGGATVSYIDSASQQTVKQTTTDTTGSYVFNVVDKRPFGIKAEKKGFFTQNLTGEAASNGKLLVGNPATGNSLVGGSSAGITGGGPSVPGTGSLAANGSIDSGKGNSPKGTSANGGLTAGGSANGTSANGSSLNGRSGNEVSSQALATSGKITDGKFVSPAIHLQAYAVNKPIVINNVLYDYGYATLRPESITVLDDLVKTMVDNPKVVIELSAHTDSIGSDAYNLKLSQDRAQACVDYMIGKGITATRISAVGYGRSKPIAPNSLPNGQDNPDGRQLNRRTEFVVKGNDKRMTSLTH